MLIGIAWVALPGKTFALSVQSKDIVPADGTSGQNLTTGSGVKTGHIQNSAVDGSKIADNAVATSKIADGAVTDAKITGPISASKIPDNGITTTKIADGAVTDAKITGLISGAKISSIGLNADTVDGRHATDFQQKYAKVAIVAQSGGDYTDLISANNDVPNWCGNPSADNPCLIKIMPGVYDTNLMYGLSTFAYVDIEGSGENVTKLTASNDGPILYGSSHSEIRFLTIENTGSDCSGIINEYASPVITYVTITVSCSSRSAGISNVGGSPLMRNVTITSAGPNVNFGVWNRLSSDVDMKDVKIIIPVGLHQYGLFSEGSTTRMRDSAITITPGGQDATTIFNDLGSTTFVANTMLHGASVFNYGTLLKCVGAFNGTYDQLSSTCQ